MWLVCGLKIKYCVHVFNIVTQKFIRWLSQQTIDILHGFNALDRVKKHTLLRMDLITHSEWCWPLWPHIFYIWFLFYIHSYVNSRIYDGFGGLVVSVLASNPAEAVGFFGRKNPQHAFLWRGSKRICPMSQLCGM